jgi:hypothetical protein
MSMGLAGFMNFRDVYIVGLNQHRRYQDRVIVRMIISSRGNGRVPLRCSPGRARHPREWFYAGESR